MRGIHNRFYSTGTDNQKKADASIELKRPDVKQIKKWKLMQRVRAANWLADIEQDFKIYVKEFRQAIKKYD